ncbi:hypothetical protein GWK47_026069 [Chionoecetes opilio]|uniref:Uncharacterized protein n=1 Tax=Chionoecetes opilio TaxID=41210 RepID=A0A8J8WAM7_CHIOP|nr:hypothetical protein GWK47_026069 [Chionoecetes opilio]
MTSVYLFPGKRHKPLLPDLTGHKSNSSEEAAHESDLALIERIAGIRQQTLDTADTKDKPKGAAPARKKGRPAIHQRLPDCAFQAITTETGRRYYLACREEDEWERCVAAVAAKRHSTCLLNTSYSALKAQAQNEQIRQDAIRARRLQREEDSGLESGPEDDGGGDEVLWVEKFKPRRYLHLLSDEVRRHGSYLFIYRFMTPYFFNFCFYFLFLSPAE